jgi:FkbM family methyltransferase
MEELINKLPDKGFFVEVGANDGDTYSHTALLADKGWKGTYIEPIPEYADKCIERHKDNNVQVIKCACGNYNGVIDLSIGNLLTTGLKEYEDIVDTLPWFENTYHGSITVPIRKLDHLIKEPIDLLVIDVEGMEYEVLECSPIAKYLIIELHKQSPEWQDNKYIKERTDKVEQLLQEKGYTLISHGEIDSYYKHE